MMYGTLISFYFYYPVFNLWGMFFGVVCLWRGASGLNLVKGGKKIMQLGGKEILAN